MFRVCIKYIQEDINSSEHGCRIGVTKSTVHARADAVVLLCPTSMGRQKLLKVSLRNATVTFLQLMITNKVVKFGPKDGLKFHINGLEIEVAQQ